jgi:hypothetical protein
LARRNVLRFPIPGLSKGNKSAGKRARIDVFQQLRRRRMTENQSDSATVGRACVGAVLIGLLLGLSACDQFDTEKIAESCVTSAIKHGEPYGNAKERANAEAQLKEYCARAAGSKRP